MIFNITNEYIMEYQYKKNQYIRINCKVKPHELQLLTPTLATHNYIRINCKVLRSL